MKKSIPKRRTPRTEPKTEDNSPPQAEETIDVKHNMTFIETIPKSQAPGIPLDPELLTEDSDSDPDDIWLDDDDEEPREIKVKHKPSVRDKLKGKLSRAGIGSSEQLQLRIDRLPSFNLNGFTGVKAEGEFLDRLLCNMDFITSEQYLEMLAKRYGPGTYRLTLRFENRNLSIWHETIGAPFSQVEETGGNPPAYPQNPPIHSGPSIKRQLAELAEMAAIIDQIRGKQTPTAPEPPAVPKEIQFASVLLSDPEVRAKAIGGLKSLMGDSSPETSTAELMMKYADPVINAFDRLVNSVVNGIQTVRSGPPPRKTFQPDQVENEQEAEELEAGIEQTELTPQTAEDVLLNRLVQDLEKKFPPELIADRLNSIADRVFQASPDQSVYTWLEIFCRYEPAAILGMASLASPRAEAAAKLPHAEQWIKEIQEFLIASKVSEINNQDEEIENAQQ